MEKFMVVLTDDLKDEEIVEAYHRARIKAEEDYKRGLKVAEANNKAAVVCACLDRFFGFSPYMFDYYFQIISKYYCEHEDEKPTIKFGDEIIDCEEELSKGVDYTWSLRDKYNPFGFEYELDANDIIEVKFGEPLI